MTTERERFEAWVGSHAKDDCGHSWGWWAREAWKAARTDLLAQLDTPEMKQKIHDSIWDRGYNSSKCVTLTEIAITAIKEKLK